jgi:hypothetical protein
MMIIEITTTLQTTYYITGFTNYAFCDDKNLYNLKTHKKVKKYIIMDVLAIILTVNFIH